MLSIWLNVPTILWLFNQNFVFPREISMKNYTFFKHIAVATILILSFSTYGGAAFEVRQKKSTILTATKIKDSVLIDGKASEDYWRTTPALDIKVTDGSIGDIDVSMKALYDQENIYFLVRWPDTTPSQSKNQWSYDPANQSWRTETFLNAKKEAVSINEDRFSIMWNIDDSVEGFNTSGCAILCHGDRMHTNAPSERIDTWHWKGSRSNPVGYADDKWLDNRQKDGYDHESREAARHGDTYNLQHGLPSFGGHYFPNKQTVIVSGNAITGPLYWEPDAEGDDALSITQEEIARGEAVKINDYALVDKGKKIPGYILHPPKGSRGDIRAKGLWENGFWTLEMQRKLQTNNNDDIIFDTTKLYRFGIAVMDNAGGFDAQGIGHSFDLGARTLEFGGTGLEAITTLSLVKDHLMVSQGYCSQKEYGLARSEHNGALALFEQITPQVIAADPSQYLVLKEQMITAKRSCSVDDYQKLLLELDRAIALLQGKIKPSAPNLKQRVFALWSRIQSYIFIGLGAISVLAIRKTTTTIRKPEFRILGLFMLAVVSPILFESLGRLGHVFKIPMFQSLSFMTSEIAIMLWALLMLAALLLCRYGFKELDSVLSRLKKQKMLIEKESLTDALTQVSNRRFFERKIAESHASMQRYGTPYSILLIDIDYFKSINDRYGHPGGDAVLLQLATLLKRNLREKVDILSRIGGEEFAIILNNTQLNQALILGERLRKDAENVTFEFEGKKIKLTISVGVANSAYFPRLNSEALITAADKSLYQAKSKGRNRVISSHGKLSSLSGGRNPLESQTVLSLGHNLKIRQKCV